MPTDTRTDDLGWTAPDFTLPGVDGRTYSLHALKGEKGTVIVFICNHCPFVRAVAGRIVDEASALAAHGVTTVAICSNDARDYPEDSFDKMRDFAARHGFSFPYLHDESQEVARAYGALCTPDFFGFDSDLRLRYRGRLDESGRQPAPPGAKRELYDAMRQVAETGRAPREQTPAIGCSIKWKAA